MEESSEILIKYQKLALEYSKLKAQISVLKAAVADEQTTSLEIQEALKKKDQLIRKLEQEIECLNFRNLQLTKRVSVLQNDLQSLNAISKHAKPKSQANNLTVLSPESQSILNIELQSRIEENEKLHQQVYALDIEHKKEIAELTSNNEELKSKLTDQEHKLNAKIQEQEKTINSLLKEKIKMQISIKNYEQQLKEIKVTEETKEHDTDLANENLKFQLENVKSLVTEKVQFNDTSIDFLNKINVPIILCQKQNKLSQLMLKLKGLISDITQHLMDLHLYLEQKVRFSFQDAKMKSLSLKLELYLHDNIDCIKSIQLSFNDIANAAQNQSLIWMDKSYMKEISKFLTKYSSHLDKIIPYLKLSLTCDAFLIGNAHKAKETSQKFLHLSQKLVNNFKKLECYVHLLVEIGSSKKEIYHVSQASIIRKIVLSLENLRSLFDELRKIFGTLISSDNSIPVKCETERSTDECILSTFVSLSSSLKKITSLMNENFDILSNDIPYKPRNFQKHKNFYLNPHVWEYKERGSNYIMHINQPEFPSVPYEVAVENCQKLSNYADNQENLTQQLEVYRNKLMQLELDKENWMLECQLMKAKESKDINSPSENGEKKHESDEMHLVVKTTVNQLVKQIQFADSKFIAYRNECESLFQKLKMSLQKQKSLEIDAENSKQIIERMKEEQKNLIASYEEQLHTMSDHLANLNETLTLQKDQIDILKTIGNNKVSKKGKSK